MDILLVSLLIFLFVGGVFAFTLGGRPSSNKASTIPAMSCPPGFSPSLAYLEKYGDTGIAYDEKQKAICILQPDTQNSQIIFYQNILAVAVSEDGSLVAKSERTDEPGKKLLAENLSEETKVLFQDNTEQSEGERKTPPGGTSSNIDLRILINNPEHPVLQIHFLNMEAKKGGVIYNEAVAQVNNWQDLLSFLIKLASKEGSQPGQTPPPDGQPATSQQQPEPAAVGNS
jgi:hypothetical protein